MRRRDFLLGAAAAVAAAPVAQCENVVAWATLPDSALYGVGPMMAALPKYRAEMARQWEETALYVLGQTVIAPGAVLTCMATDG